MPVIHQFLSRSRAGLLCLSIGWPASGLMAQDGPAAAPAEKSAAAPAGEAGARRGFLGVTLTEICPEVRAQTTLKEGEGLMIGRVAPESPAAVIGLRQYDILTRFNDQWLMSTGQLVTLIENTGPDAEAELTYLRQSQPAVIKVRLGRIPAKPPTADTVPPAPPEMLTAVIRTLRDNPIALEAVHRYLHAIPTVPDGALAAPAVLSGQRHVMRDAAGKVELTSIGNTLRLRAWNAEGTLCFDGPCGTPDHDAALPGDLKVRYERLQRDSRTLATPRTAAEPVVVPAPSPLTPE
jgi:PDZ domain